LTFRPRYPLGYRLLPGLPSVGAGQPAMDPSMAFACLCSGGIINYDSTMSFFLEI